MKRFLIVALAIVLIIVVAAGLAVRYHTRSDRVARRVETHMKTLYGGPVRVGDVDVGLGSTSVTAFELFEEGDDDKKGDPWLKIASLTTDISLWDLISGNAFPKNVKVTGAVLMLRFDREGTLLTRFPGQTALEESEARIEPAEPGLLPAIEVETSEIVFRKEGHPDVNVKNISGSFADEKGRGVLSGTGNSAELGKLNLQGSLKEYNQATVHLKTETKSRVTQAILNRLPFVPAEAWQEIQIAEGTTSAHLTLRCNLQDQIIHYLLDLDPENTRFSVPSIDLRAENASGKVTVDDDRILFRDIQAHAFGGLLHADAELDFRDTVSKLRFTKIKVVDLSVNEVPNEWNIPPAIRKSKGKLSGHATLDVILSATPTPLHAAALVGMVSSHDFAWLPSVGLMSTFRVRFVHTRGQGKGQIRDRDDHREPVEFDWHIPVTLNTLR